jgi:hypothetical protein
VVEPARQQLFDEPEAEFAIGTADAGAATLPRLEGDETRPGVEILVNAFDPTAGREVLRALRILEPHLGYDLEFVRELPDVPGLLVIAQIDRPIGDLDELARVRGAELPEVVEPILEDELLEQRPTEIEVHPDVRRIAIFCGRSLVTSAVPHPNFTKSRNSAPLSTTSSKYRVGRPPSTTIVMPADLGFSDLSGSCRAVGCM